MTDDMSVSRGLAHTDSETTRIEQARAVADVLAAMEWAHRYPRDEDDVERKMIKACKRQLVADRAFWSFKRGNELLTGPTIHLARTIGVIWKNIQFGYSELGRDDSKGVSQMTAWAWDLETNARTQSGVLIPHFRDVTQDGRKVRRKLDTMRDITDNNANIINRRVRTAIFNILPDWYVEMAEETCRAIVERKDEPLEKVQYDTAQELIPLGVPLDRILARVGRETWAETTKGDLATLRIIAKTIGRGEATVREQFPEPEVERPAGSTARLGKVETPAMGKIHDTPEGDPAAPADAPDEQEPATPMDRTQQRSMMAGFADLGLGGKTAAVREKRLSICSALVERPLASSSDLDTIEADLIIAALRGWVPLAQPDRDNIIDDLLAGWSARQTVSTDPAAEDDPRDDEPTRPADTTAPAPSDGTEDGTPAEPTADPEGTQ